MWRRRVCVGDAVTDSGEGCVTSVVQMPGRWVSSFGTSVCFIPGKAGYLLTGGYLVGISPSIILEILFLLWVSINRDHRDLEIYHTL